MSCDISQVFSSIIGTIRAVKEISNPPNDGSKSSEADIRTSSQNEFSFFNRACGLRSNLQTLSGYLRRINQLTAGTIGNRFKQRMYSDLTEQVAKLIDQCTILLNQLHEVASIDDRGLELTDNNSQLSLHRLAVYRSLHEELGKLKKRRDAEMERQRRLLELTGSLASGVKNLHQSGQNDVKFDTLQTSVRNRLPLKKTVPIGDQQLIDDLESENRRHHNEFSETEMRTFEMENMMLLNQLDQEREEVHHVAQSITEIGRLNQTMSEHLIMQLEQTEQIAGQTVSATENIRLANEQLREAINRKASLQSCLLFVLIVLTFSLHFLDWYYP